MQSLRKYSKKHPHFAAYSVGNPTIAEHGSAEVDRATRLCFLNMHTVTTRLSMVAALRDIYDAPY